MNRRSYPSGQTSSAVLKALLRSIDAEKGAAGGEAWLRAIHMVREDLEDETRLVPIMALHTALAEYAKVLSKEKIPETWKTLIMPDCLGVWMRVLRGTSSPAEAFARLDASDSEYGRTTRWDTLEVQPGYWRGRVSIAHDPALEEDGLLRLARLAELTAIPALFGFGRPVVRDLGATAKHPNAQEFEARWRVAHPPVTVSIGAIAGGAIGALPAAFGAGPIELSVALIVGAAAVGGGLGLTRAREARRRVETYAQARRVDALERSLVLKENRDRSAAGHLEGSVAAGQYRIKQRMGFRRERRHLRSGAHQRRNAGGHQAPSSGCCARRCGQRLATARGRGPRPLVASQRRRTD